MRTLVRGTAVRNGTRSNGGDALHIQAPHADRPKAVITFQNRRLSRSGRFLTAYRACFSRIEFADIWKIRRKGG
jgi:hypothetical protein